MGDGINSLPLEILSIIFNFLEIGDFIELSEVNSYINNCMKNEWGKRLLRDYSYNYEPLYCHKTTYISLYNTLCKVCYKKTNVKHLFFNSRICRKCSENDINYAVISKTKAMKNFLLSNIDLKNLNYVCKNINKYHRKFFLLKQVQDASIEKHGGQEILERKIENLRQKKIRNRILYMTKFMILRSTLSMDHNIEIMTISNYINHYSKGLFRRYISSISPNRQDPSVLDKLIMYCIELDYIRQFYNFSGFTYEDFDEMVKYKIIFGDITVNTNSIFLRERMFNLLLDCEIILKRKQEILVLLDDIEFFSIEDPSIKRYITKGDLDPYEIRLDYLEERLVIKNMDFIKITRAVLFDSKKTKREIYFDFISKWIKNGGKVCNELKKRYIL
jgi:hypothetical protein